MTFMTTCFMCDAQYEEDGEGTCPTCQAESAEYRRTMHITIKDINALPDTWAESLAKQYDPSFAITPHGVLRENWPDCKPQVVCALEDLIELEDYYTDRGHYAVS